MDYGEIELTVDKNISKFKTYSEKRLYLKSLIKNRIPPNRVTRNFSENKELIRDYLHNWYISNGNRIIGCNVRITSGNKSVYDGKCIVIEESTCITIEPKFTNSIFEINRN